LCIVPLIYFFVSTSKFAAQAAFFNSQNANGLIVMRLAFYGSLLLVPICMVVSNGRVWGQSPYRMEGEVTDADTQKPVPNTTVQVLISSESEPSQRIRKSLTNDDGRYSIELPAGHGWAWNLVPPDGYCSVESNPTEVFATSDDRPIFTKNYQIRRGIPIQFAVRYPDTLTASPKTFVSLGQQKGNEYINGSCELDEKGTGTVTMPQLTGKFNVYCADEKQALVVPDGMAADFEEGFDPRNVLPDVVAQDDGIVVVRDANSRAATLTKCAALVRDRQLIITINVSSVRSDDESTQLQGRVVDANADGIQGATVTVAFYYDGGSASSQITATTNTNGEFSVAVPKLSADQKIGLIVTRRGFGGLETPPIQLPSDANSIASLGPITLKAGCSVRVRVVGPDGIPLHGAVVEPLNDYASRTRIARTGPDGECRLTDLVSGLMRVSAQFGTLATSTKIPLDPGENEIVILKLAPPATTSSKDQRQRPPALAAGNAAPEWIIAEWTDGKDRRLSDYNGKVVVLDFWGVWCGPCIQGIPAMKELHDRYKAKDVVFFGIHTAGTDMTLVKRLLKQQEWDIIVGLDSGEEIVTGETVQRYAIQGYPSVIVVDRHGTIAFNSGDVPKDRDVFMREMKMTAKSAGLPWPIDKDATKEEVMERMTRLQVVMYSRMIDEALNVQSD
jgi:thiol-disulfide isomerase/thioredoxin